MAITIKRIPGEGLERLVLRFVSREYNKAFASVTRGHTPISYFEALNRLPQAYTFVAYDGKIPVGFTLAQPMVSPTAVALVAAAVNMREDYREGRYDPDGRYASEFVLGEIVHIHSQGNYVMRSRLQDEGTGATLPPGVNAGDEPRIRVVSNTDFEKLATVVVPSHRKRGIATKLTKAVEATARRLDAARVFAFVITDNPMYRVNSRLDYEPILSFQNWYGDGSAMTLMGKELK